MPFGIVSILIGRTTLPNPPTRAEGYDTLGAVMCAATFGLAITGLESGVHGDSPIVSAALVVLAVAVGIVFIRRQPRAGAPACSPSICCAGARSRCPPWRGWRGTSPR